MKRGDVTEVGEARMTYSQFVGRHYREEMRARCVDFGLRMAAVHGGDVLETARALEAYIFGEQP